VLAALAGISLVPARAAAEEPTKEQCVAANESAQDLQRAGKLVAARVQLLTCTAKVCPKVVRQDCSERLKNVEKDVATVVLTPKDGHGARVRDASLEVDGAARPDALDGTPLLVDPGLHTFTVSSGGKPPASVQLSLSAGEHAKADVVFKSEGGEEATPAASEAPAAPTPVAPSREPSTARLLGWSSLGVGVAGLAFWGVTGAMQLSALGKVKQECHPHCESAQQREDLARFQTYGDAATIGLVVGGAGVVTGAVLLLFFRDAPARADHPAAIRVHPWIGPGDGGLRGTF
jgi:hypothetical protein